MASDSWNPDSYCWVSYFRSRVFEIADRFSVTVISGGFLWQCITIISCCSKNVHFPGSVARSHNPPTKTWVTDNSVSIEQIALFQLICTILYILSKRFSINILIFQVSPYYGVRRTTSNTYSRCRGCRSRPCILVPCLEHYTSRSGWVNHASTVDAFLLLIGL